MDERDRLDQLASLPAYASSKGVFVIPLHHRAPDGELISLGVANLPDPDSPADFVRRSITFSARGGAARLREEHEKDDGGREAIGFEVPYDFSGSYRIADIWRGSTESDEQTWEEFDDAESLIDFLADRLNPEP